MQRMLMLCLALCAGSLGRVDAQPEAVELLGGTLEGWHVEGSDGSNFRLRDGLLRVEGPEGWLRSAAAYADFDLVLEFRFLTDDADSGVFLRAAGEEAFGRGWPSRSYQVQLRNPFGESRFPPFGGLFRHGMPAAATAFDEPLARRVTRPTGEWQQLELDVTDSELRARINGTEVLVAGGIGNARGFIGLQGETGALEFRSIRLRERTPR